MSFIGVLSSKKCFENIKNEVRDENINFIHINLRSIQNVKNIKFETIIMEDSIDKFKTNKEALEALYKNTQYILINTDKNPEQNEIKKIPNQITYGLNRKATVTVSSISDTDILVYCQDILKSKKGESIEIEERRIKKGTKKNLKTYEILIAYILFKIYNKSIMDEIQEKSDFFE